MKFAVPVLIGICGLYLTGVGIVIGLINRSEDKSTQQQAAIPKLRYIAARPTDFGYIITLSNGSPVTSAAITHLTYRVSNPKLLKVIAEIDPPPRDGCYVESANSLDKPVFKWGHWIDKSCYEFFTEVGYHVDAGGVSDIKPQIKNCDCANVRFVGTLGIFYNNGGPPLRLNQVAIVAQHDH